MKRMSGFKKGYLIYVAILVILLAAVFFYVRGVMVEYEESGSEQYALRLAEEATKSGSALAAYMEENCFADNCYSGSMGDYARRAEQFAKTVKSAKLEVTVASGSHDSSHPVYNILADGKPFLTLALAEGESKTKLGIIPLTTWEIASCVLRAEDSATEPKIGVDGLLRYTIKIPEGFTLYLDGVSLSPFIRDDNYLTTMVAGNGVTEGKMVPIDGFAYVYDVMPDMPYMIEAELEGLTFEPVFTATDNAGKATEVVIRNGVVSVTPNYASSSAGEALYKSAGLDALEIGKTWSRFMTNDVSGDSRGLFNVRSTCRLLEGTDLYQKATSWANNVDITFVSVHTLTGWARESVDNFVKYSENAFSCDVHFDKNMILKTGAYRTDPFDNRMFFIQKDGKWYLADMFAL